MIENNNVPENQEPVLPWEDTTETQLDEVSSSLDFIATGLSLAQEYGLEIEVIYYALKAMKENPELTPAQAFYLGVSEWVK